MEWVQNVTKLSSKYYFEDLKHKAIEVRKIKDKNDFKKVLNSCVEKSKSMENFRLRNVKTALKQVKFGKADSINRILSEFLKYLGLKGSVWIESFLLSVKNNNLLPKL